MSRWQLSLVTDKPTVIQGACSATTCQIGPRLIKIGPIPDHFLMQIRTKSGPKYALNPDQYRKIRLLPVFSENSRHFQLCNTSTSSLNSWLKRPFSALILPFFGQIRTFLCKSGPFPDQFLEKSPDPDQSPEKTDQMGALHRKEAFTRTLIFKQIEISFLGKCIIEEFGFKILKLCLCVMDV